MQPQARRKPSEPARDVRINLVQGDYHVTGDPNAVLATLLGSCVAACMRDPEAGVGGMNHFLLPSGEGFGERDMQRYGVHAMELLVNGLLRLGARRERLEAHLFGGARMSGRLADIGGTNADFAVDFLRREGIGHVGGSLRGERARRIQFWPTTGRVRQLLVSQRIDPVQESPRKVPALETAGQVDLF